MLADDQTEKIDDLPPLKVEEKRVSDDQKAREIEHVELPVFDVRA